MADTRAARASRRASGRATTKLAAANARGRPRAGRTTERSVAGLHAEHPGEHDDHVDADAGTVASSQISAGKKIYVSLLLVLDVEP